MKNLDYSSAREAAKAFSDFLKNDCHFRKPYMRHYDLYHEVYTTRCIYQFHDDFDFDDGNVVYLRVIDRFTGYELENDLLSCWISWLGVLRIYG